MDKKLFIPIILGTNREGRNSEKVAKWILGSVKEREDIETKLIDVKDINLPSDGYGQVLKDKFPEYRDTVSSADGLIIVTPEYNHGIPGPLKSLLDILLKEYSHKSVGLVGVSSGSWGGVRAIENIVNIVRKMGLVTLSRDLPVPNAGDLFDEEGNILDDKFHDRLNKFLDELVWMSKALRWGRESLK